MPVPITCSGCSATMTAPDSFIGKRVSCPKCKTSFVIPDPKAIDDFEVVEDEVLDVAEVIEDDEPPAKPVPKPVMPVAAKTMGAAPAMAGPIAAAIAGAAAAVTTGKLKKPNPRYKKQVDPSDYRTRVNGKPLALKPGEAMPPTSLPRKSEPRD